MQCAVQGVECGSGLEQGRYCRRHSPNAKPVGAGRTKLAPYHAWKMMVVPFDSENMKTVRVMQ